MNNTQPRVSIGMPVYNGAIYLKQALDSLLAQTFQDFELIVSDNGSTDATAEICRAYADQDSRIRYYRNEQNLGAGWNFNRVLELANSKYFRWACHDDMCAPELLQQCVEILDCNPAVVLCYPKTIIINEHEQQVEKYVDDFNLRSPEPHKRFKQYHQIVRYGHGCHPLFGLIRTDILKQTARMGSYPSSDLVLLGELVLNGEFYEIPEYLFFKRDHPNTSVRAHRAFRQRIAWYDPSKEGKLHLTRWKWFLEYLAAIKRSPINFAEKTQCYLQMLRWMRWNSIWLSKDLTKAAIWPLLQLFLNFNSERQLAKKAQT
ncbi:glycosyltransferase family 2 protein [Gloeocapsopsis crepidinum LEGE 06123]|uniref:Glycosyltransferase family 2 protein n=1 Tax=Gloeocapsopsis crepidinum LEGE 06123 TaxID=588587 RepID=A0ABR9URV6_9CHRO|nr:glycosyltransferase family 2 protein [Gloeocapsopsis crepidinum]MBE9190999.1 glycosyltransferase family 2 protein [Gloeocapsopsis crepidinum LEGE 06123]